MFTVRMWNCKVCGQTRTSIKVIFAFFHALSALFYTEGGIFGSLSSFLCGHVHFMADLKANIILQLKANHSTFLRASFLAASRNSIM